MAWGFFFGSTHGKFFPSGEFERGDVPGKRLYRQRLDRHYNLASDEEKKRLFNPEAEGGASYPSYVASKLRSEDGTRYQEMLPKELPERLIESHELPRSFDAARPIKALGDIVETNQRILAVSEAFKDVIEMFEAGVHKFFPITVTDPVKGEIEQKYFIFVIQKYLDSFRPNESEDGSFEPTMQLYRFENSKAGLEGLALAKDVFAGSHLWVERRFASPLFCLSDELEAAIHNAGLAIPNRYRMREV
jgi:hypothetical protein